MDLNLNLSMNDTDEAEVTVRVKKAKKKKEEAQAEPTWAEKWQEIFSRKNSATDLERLKEVKRAVEMGEIGLEAIDVTLKKFSKASALRLYKVLEESRKDRYIQEMIDSTPENYHLINTEEALEKLVHDLKFEEVIGLDTETTGLDVIHGEDEMVGMSISLEKADYHVYIPFIHQDTSVPQLDRMHVLKRLKHVLTSKHIKKVLHNYRFDAHVFLNYGIRLKGLFMDTRVAMAILNENEPTYALKPLSTKYGKYFGFKDESKAYEELFGKVGFQEVPLDIALHYACKDTHLTLKFARFIETHLKKQPALWALYKDIENPLCDVVVDMEQTGFRIDMDFASEYGEELKLELAELEIKLRGHFGDINIASPAQLAEVLYDKLKLPDVSNKRSTDAKTLKKLKAYHKGIEDLLAYRDKFKLLSTYVEALPSKVKRDGNIHGSFNQVSTVTGRFSSNDPNLQNLPARARRLIVAPEGKLIIGIDYSQIEPRVLAHISGDESMIQAYVNGRDLYVEMAMKVFKLEEKYCADGAYDPTGRFQPRKAVKSILLGIMYGLGIPSLAEQIGISIEEATQIRLDFFEAFPKVKKFIRETWEFVKENEYVEMMFGRKRRFPNHKQEAIQYDKLASQILHILHAETSYIGDEVPFDFWKWDAIPYKLKKAFQAVKGNVERVRRMAVNAIIQGSAAIILKISMVALQEHCLTKGWTVNATVHDENLILVDDTITLQEVEELEAIMLNAIQMQVPTKVDTEIFARWGEGISKKDYFKVA